MKVSSPGLGTVAQCLFTKLPQIPLHRRVADHRRFVLASTMTERATKSFGDGSQTRFSPVLNGTWAFAGGHGRAVFDSLEETLSAHAEAGFTTYDTADIYGPSEEILGNFSTQWSASGKPSLQLFTKYVPNIFRQRPTAADVEAAIRKSLKALQVDSFDLVQLHWWDYSIPGFLDTAKALVSLRNQGLLKSIGTTNIDTVHLKQLVDAGVPVVSNQAPLNGMVEYCDQQGIYLFAYGSVVGGLLSDRYVEEPRAGLFGKPKYSTIDLNTSSKKMYWNMVSRFGGQELYRQLLVLLRQIADKHNVSVANVAVRWVMQQSSKEIICPIIGMRDPSHVADNTHLLSLSLDDEDLSRIAEFLEASEPPYGDPYSWERQ